ncbi:low-specificity L-threonine aldolase [Duganella phyllosphaerae]|uniref:Low specificity L-threonine aldolase n=1 Tax=Duganella phyllosphaerae TaxID=762836 RepID=A0A1E7WF67_9BURK|nr:low-specificity L-threonine aldolase [Duganella phyllosphaerae]OEZ96992.1 Low specificity L-threonine aldolase [Duganella phyllosphaerae]
MAEHHENWLDLRSDTVTRPSAAMRAAMNAAEVGDDVYGDDPTVNRLQEYAADLFGYEDALFAPSGTQSNLLALLVHCGRGDEYLVGQEAHTYKYEGGGAAVLGSIQPQPIINQPDGSIALDDIAAYIKPDDFHFARTRLLALENTIGGRVLSLDTTGAATKLAHDKGLATHLDGARLCNAAVKLGVSPREALAGFDSASICLSKGLGAPVGSILCGTRPLIKEARRWRKMLGGGMRQAGMIAAGGLYALEHNIGRLADDHANAAYFAGELAKMKNIKVSTPQTNIFYVDIPAFVCQGLNDVLQLTRIRVSMAPRLRIVTHMDATRDDIDRAITVFGDFFG